MEMPLPFDLPARKMPARKMPDRKIPEKLGQLGLKMPGHQFGLFPHKFKLFRLRRPLHFRLLASGGQAITSSIP